MTHHLSLVQRYEKCVAEKNLEFDTAQWTVLQFLQTRLDELESHSKRHLRVKRWSWKSRDITKQGVYLFGDVGRGKSMLMTWFYEACQLQKKRRVHFHVFMQEVHLFIHKHLNQNALLLFAKQVRETTHLLCFDEFYIDNIADAMLLSCLFETLFEEGVFVVMTSNYHPDNLYPNGFQRASLLPFIAMLHKKIALIELAGKQDYRVAKLNKTATRYFFPLTEQTQITLLHYGSQPNSALFSFAQLCGQPNGTRDYLALAQQIDNLVLTHIPQLSPERHNETQRFITLIDVLYEYKVTLVCSAEVAIDELCLDGKNKNDFERTRSRLIEMQSIYYSNHFICEV